MTDEQKIEELLDSIQRTEDLIEELKNEVRDYLFAIRVLVNPKHGE
jgi:hypothetical protein